MCLAIPGKIVKIEEDRAVVEYYNGEKTNAKIVEGNYKEGDYVIVQAKLVVEKVPKKEAVSWIMALQNAS
jgi:hydrogenase expression/formation protein HypC